MLDVRYRLNKQLSRFSSSLHSTKFDWNHHGEWIVEIQLIYMTQNAVTTDFFCFFNSTNFWQSLDWIDLIQHFQNQIFQVFGSA